MPLIPVPDSRKKRVYIIPLFTRGPHRGAIFNMKDHTLPAAWDYEEGTLNMFGGGVVRRDHGDHLAAARRELGEELPGIFPWGSLPLTLLTGDEAVKVYTVDLGELPDPGWRKLIQACEEGIPVPVTRQRFLGAKTGRPMTREEFTTDLSWEAARRALGAE